MIAGLIGWAHAYKFEVDWIYDCALARLYQWDHGDASDVWRLPRQMGGGQISWDEFAFTFGVPGWVPQLHRRSDYEKRTRAAFENHLKEYLDKIQVAAKDRGLIHTPEWRKRGTRSTLRRFEWLVRWQVQKWRLVRIAKEAKAARNTVRDGIRAAASEIGLPVRVGKPGRPRKPET